MTGRSRADDQGEPGGQLTDHVRCRDVVAGGVVLAGRYSCDYYGACVTLGLGPRR